MVARPDNLILPHTSGLMDVAGGFKFAAVVMPEYQFILSPILRFQFPIGTRRVYQGNGNLQIRLNQANGGGQVALNHAQAALGTGGFEGLDVTNFGSRGVDSNTLITGALGVRITLPGNVSLSAAWEGPSPGSGPRYIQRQRVTTNLSYEF